MGVLRIGTRRSALARWQAERVRALLAARGVNAELIALATTGDEDQPPVPQGVAAKGLFTKEIEDALLAEQIDLAVHSLKDLMIELPPGLVLAAVPERADPRDAVLSANRTALADLPTGARVGTTSTRRRAAVAAARPDLEIVPLRGNVPTRVRRVMDGALDAAILAMAGLLRLDLAALAEPIDPVLVLPAAGQGALAVQARAGDRTVYAQVTPLDDPQARAAIEAERAALAGLDTGCDVPIGAWCRREGTGLVLRVAVYAVDGRAPLTARVAVGRADAAAAGREAAAQLLAAGAEERIRQAADRAASAG